MLQGEDTHTPGRRGCGGDSCSGWKDASALPEHLDVRAAAGTVVLAGGMPQLCLNTWTLRLWRGQLFWLEGCLSFA